MNLQKARKLEHIFVDISYFCKVAGSAFAIAAAIFEKAKNILLAGSAFFLCASFIFYLFFRKMRKMGE